jgi:hypothetical protein
MRCVLPIAAGFQIASDLSRMGCDLRAFRFLLFFLITAVSWRFAAGQIDVPAGAQMLTHPNGATTQYVQLTQTEKLHNYLFEAFGPYPLAWTTIVAGYHQAKRNPPDWREGIPGFGERYASDFGNSAVNITTRFTVAEALHEDTLYYRCTCSGVGARLRHALYWTVFAHRGADGHAAFALPVFVAPYAANMTAVYGWYPRRYGAEDAFRMGNYGLLSYAIGNISLEFLAPVLHAKRNSILARLHFDNRHLAPEPQP